MTNIGEVAIHTLTTCSRRFKSHLVIKINLLYLENTKQNITEYELKTLGEHLFSVAIKSDAGFNLHEH
jgi:hypothetical protein